VKWLGLAFQGSAEAKPNHAWIVIELLKHLTYYRVGKFRMRGESHKWMYDRYSMRELLLAAGFTAVQQASAYESRIADFATYGLDLYKGQKRGESSLFMEAIKPLDG
jgi:hypothetical protein